jgi:hypothetical protein
VPQEIDAVQPADAADQVQVVAAPVPAIGANPDLSTTTPQPQARRVVYPIAVPSIPDLITAPPIEPGRAATTAPVEP